jgi:hypothetical protein
MLIARLAGLLAGRLWDTGGKSLLLALTVTSFLCCLRVAYHFRHEMIIGIHIFIPSHLHHHLHVLLGSLVSQDLSH